MTKRAYDNIATGLGKARGAEVAIKTGAPSSASMWTLGAALAEIDRLRSALDRLVCLDVTAREGQRAFAEWRNAYAALARTPGS